MAVSPQDRLVKGLQSVAALSAEAEAALRQVPIRVQPVDPRHDIIREGDRESECTLVLSGFLCRHKAVCNDRRQILSFHLPGEIPDLHGLHLDASDFGLGALTASSVGLMPHAAIRSAMAAAPSLVDVFWRASLLDASMQRTWLASMGRRSAYQRVAHLFCEVFVRMKALGVAEEAGFVLPMTQTELGDALGISAVHVNRTLQQLRHEQIIVSHGRHYGFTNWERLRKAANFDPSYLQLAAAAAEDSRQRI